MSHGKGHFADNSEVYIVDLSVTYARGIVKLTRRVQEKSRNYISGMSFCLQGERKSLHIFRHGFRVGGGAASSVG